MTATEEKVLGEETGEGHTDVQQASQNADINDERVEDVATGNAANDDSNAE